MQLDTNKEYSGRTTLKEVINCKICIFSCKN